MYNIVCWSKVNLVFQSFVVWVLPDEDYYQRMGLISTCLLMCLTNEKEIDEILTAAECICPHISNNINKSFFALILV